MPIDIEAFETAPAEELRDETRPVRDSILEFLAYNPDQAYSRRELQASLDLDAISLLHALSVLEGEGLLRHKGHYWALGVDPERLDLDVDA